MSEKNQESNQEEVANKEQELAEQEQQIQLPSSMQPGDEGYFVIYNKNINIPCKVTRVAFLTNKVLYDVALKIEAEGKNAYIIFMDNIDSVFIQKEQVID